MLKEHASSFTKEELSEGLTAVISIKLKEPQFEGQTKQKLGNRLARTAEETLAFQRITIFFEQNPAIAKAICEKALLAQHAKNAARHARELTRSRQAAAGMSLPGKLADCSERDAEKCELFIVEGDSAAVPPRWPVPGSPRPSCLCAARSSTSKSPSGQNLRQCGDQGP